MKTEITTHNAKNYVTLILLLSTIAILLVYPSKCAAGVKLGINISLYSLIPAILPFMIFSNFVIRAGYSTLIGKLVHPLFGRLFKTSQNGSYAVALGFLCGYPLGAKITSDLIKSGKITPQEGTFIFRFINNPSPAFILCYASSLCFPDTSLKLKALVAIYLPSLMIGIFSSKDDFSCHYYTNLKYNSNDNSNNHSNISSNISSNTDSDISSNISSNIGSNTGPDISSNIGSNHIQDNPPFSKVIDDSIFDAFFTIAKLTGYIIIFSIITTLLTSLDFIPYFIKDILPCMLELTSGIYHISISAFSDVAKFIITVIFSVFGGMSVVFQINSVTQTSSLDIFIYIKYKLISMFLCSMICLIMLSMDFM